MVFEQHIAVLHLSQNLNLACHMGENIPETFALAALHLLCRLHDTVRLMKGYLELAVYTGHRPALEYIVGDDPHSCSFLQKFPENFRFVIYTFQQHDLVFHYDPARISVCTASLASGVSSLGWLTE